MKSQYLFDIVFIRLAAKTDLFPNFRILLVVDLSKNTPALKNKYYHALKLERQQRIINLKLLEPFRLTLDQDDANSDSYSLQIKEDEYGQVVEVIPLATGKTLRNFEVDGKTCNDQRHEGTYMNLNFKIMIQKALPEQPTLSAAVSKESNQQVRQTLTRTRRPPMLASVKSKKSQLQETQKIRQQALKEDGELVKTEQSKPLFQGLADKPVPKHQIKLNIVERQKDPTGWQPLSAIPEQLSAWLKKKVRPMQPSEVQEVKQLIQSHHPENQETTTAKLSIKLKIVIVMLIMGFFILIADMLKKQTYKLLYGKYPKPAKGKNSPKTAKQSQKAEKRPTSKVKKAARSKARRS